jgi:hypothetical protein
MSIRIDATHFNQAIKELSRLSGVGIEEVIRSETAAVLQKAMNLTQSANAGLIRDRQARGKISKDKMQELLKRRGLAKQSWLRLADQLGLPVQAPAYVQNALVKGKPYPQKIQSEQKGKRGNFMIKITNSMITMINAGGKGALAKAINGRTGYFRRNLKSRVFGNWKTIAQKYPGMSVKGL